MEKGLTLGEIKLLTGFETQKIEDVSQYLLTDENTGCIVIRQIAVRLMNNQADKVINEKRTGRGNIS